MWLPLPLVNLWDFRLSVLCSLYFCNQLSTELELREIIKEARGHVRNLEGFALSNIKTSIGAQLVCIFCHLNELNHVWNNFQIFSEMMLLFLARSKGTWRTPWKKSEPVSEVVEPVPAEGEATSDEESQLFSKFLNHVSCRFNLKYCPGNWLYVFSSLLCQGEGWSELCQWWDCLVAKASGTCGVPHLQAFRGSKNKNNNWWMLFAFKLKALWIIELNN